MSTTYRTEPDHDLRVHPNGIPYIVVNEAAERFSYYGMRSILMVHMQILFAFAAGVQGTYHEVMEFTRTAAEELPPELAALISSAKDEAQVVVHLFSAGVYALPILGALIADRLLGKYKTILSLSLVYCAGHGVLAFWDNTIFGMQTGLFLIALGAGGIK